MKEPERPPNRTTEAERLLATGLFRHAAVEEHTGGSGDAAGLLRNDPGWTRWSYRLVSAGIGLLLLFAVFAPVHEYAGGPAVVRLAGHLDVPAVTGGTVRGVAVAPGARVAAGDPLVHFHDEREEGESRHLRSVFEARLRQYLQDPEDPPARAALTEARRALDLAATRLEELTVRAPEAGVVGDVWVQPGERVEPGRPLLALHTGGAQAGEAETGRLIAFLPGYYRPLLRPGQILRLRLRGYPNEVRTFTVQEVNDELIGPAEAASHLGSTLEGSLAIAESVVPVRARVVDRSFELDGREVRLHDGMLGWAEVPVRSESLLLSLVPWLDELPWIPGEAEDDAAP